MTTQPNPVLSPPAADHADIEDVPFTVVDRRRLRAGVQIDNDLFDRYAVQLGPYGLAVYVTHLRLANQPEAREPSSTRIAKLIGLSPQRVQRELKKLKHLGLLAGEMNQTHEDHQEEVR